jgi:competence ComEA-like helix-hairpin-helix protein
LLDVTAPSPQNQPAAPQNLDANRPPPGGRTRSTQTAPAQNTASQQPTGPKLIDENLLMDIADDVTTSYEADLPGLINVNTASPEVLACLPGIDERLAQAIVNYRQSSGFFPNVAHLLKVDGLSREIFKQVAPRVTVRSETYRILSEGTVRSTGARKRIQVIVRIGESDIETLSYRDDL